MEDSLEDYIRLTKNTDTPKEPNPKISKEFLLTAQRRKECEAYALKIVEFLIEGKLRPEIFLRCLKYINPEYYQDVVEERAISSLCGYSLCGKKITNMPKQKYIISSKANKIYEISERKNFCSNFCYKASMHIKNQLDTSPLWIRNKSETPQIRLLSASEMGVPGALVDQGLAIPVQEQQSSFTSITQFTQVSLQLVEDIEKRPNNQSSKLKSNMKAQRQSSLNVIDEENDHDNCDNDTQSETDEERSVACDSEIEEISSAIGSIKFEEPEEVLEKPIINKDEKKKIRTMNEKEKLEFLKKKLKISKEPKTKLVDALPMNIRKTKLEVITEDTTESVILEAEGKAMDPILLKIKSCVMSWLTMDSYIYIHGENKVKEIVNEKKLSECFEKMQLDGLRQDQHIKYMNICKKVQLQEWAEEKFDSTVLNKNNLKPVPNFHKLKEDSKEMQLKVQSFFTGVLYEQEDTNFPTQDQNKENEDEAVAVLPLVDAYSKNALRRRVFFNSINKMLKKHIQEFKLGGNSILSDIHDFVKTFQLEAYNIVFKPAQWNIISLLLLEMLTIKDFSLKKNLQDPRWREYMSLFTTKLSGADLFYKDTLKIMDDLEGFVERHLT